jgi:hypothetical protein
MNLLNKINSPDAINNFKKFGVDLPKALQQAYAKGKTPLEAIAELTQQATKGDLSKLPFLFGDAQVQAALRPLIQNIGLYRQIRSDALGATGVVEGDFNRRMQDDAARNEQAMARIQAAAIKVGNVLLPIFGRIADFVGRAADAFSNLDPTAQTAIVVIGMIATVLGPLLIVIGAVVSAVGAIGAALGVAFLPAIGIIAAVVAVVALLAGAAYLIYQNWGKITAFFTGIWNDIKTAFDGGLMGVLALLFKWQTDLILALWDAVSGAVGWLISNFPAIWAGFKTVMWNVLWNGLLLLPRLFFQFGVNTLTGFMDGIRSIGASLWKLVTGLADRVKNTFKSVLGINSPSRVFAQLGGFMMEGLEQGLDRGAESPIARLKTAGDAMRKVMAGSILMTAQPAIAATSIGGPGHAPASASASAAPVTIGELHVHPSPGMDEKALADLVIKKILELRRQDDAAKRSSFKDDD